MYRKAYRKPLVDSASASLALWLPHTLTLTFDPPKFDYGLRPPLRMTRYRMFALYFQTLIYPSFIIKGSNLNIRPF